MRYIGRNQDDTINTAIGHYARPQPGRAEEAIDDADPEFLAAFPTETQTAQHNAAIDAQIDALERVQQLPRVVREYLLTDFAAKAAAQGMTEPQLYAASVAYKKVKDFDQQIRALRLLRV